MSDTTRDPHSFVPLTSTVYQILVALAEGARHGYAIMKEVEDRTGGRLVLSTGTLYAAIRRLLADGLIEETSERPGVEQDDRRRRYYILTHFGRQVAAAETRRMATLLSVAQARGLATESLLPGADGGGP